MILEPIQQTEEEKFKNFMRSFNFQINRLYESMNEQHKGVFKTFWNSKYDPQLIADTMGFEKSIMLFQLSSAIQEILKADPNYKELVPPKNVDFSSGQVIISDLK